MSKAAAINNECNWFFRDLAVAKQRVLIVDYDGTAAPFSADRSRAFPYPEVPALLQQISLECNTRLILITGRSPKELAPLLGLNPVPEIWGTYGVHRLYPDGRHEGLEISDAALEALAEAERLLEIEGLGELLDVRPAAVAVHWRGLTPSDLLEIRTIAYRTFQSMSRNCELLVADFDGGIELRIPEANTGDAVRSIISELSDDVAIAYLGDDTPDEEAFRVLNGRGLTVLVRPMHRFTAAQLWLRPPDELSAFLYNWIHVSARSS